MAWKVHSAFHASGKPTHAAYPGGAYRIRLDWGEDQAAFESWAITATSAGRYVLPYIEIGYTASPATWLTEMNAWATAFANVRAVNPDKLEYVEFGNEINMGTPGSAQNNPYNTYQELWDGYIERLRISSPLFRAADIGVICTCLGPTVGQDTWFQHLHNRGAYKLFDGMAVHCYAGGSHLDGSPAGGLPADSLRKLQDFRAAMDATGHPEVDFWVTEIGWPTIAAEATDPTHQTYCTPAQQATRLSNLYTQFYANAAATRTRMVAWFITTDYQPDSFLPRVNGETTGNWPVHHGIKWETGTPRCATEDGVYGPAGTCRKPSWDAFVNDAGIGRGTAGVKPALTAPSVTNITSQGATISGTVDPNGLPTTWRVEVGNDANFGTRTTTATIATGNTPVPVTKALTARPSGATQHVRFTAWNDAGFSWSTKTTFVTLGTGPGFLVTPNRAVPAGDIARTTNEPIPSVSHPALLPNQTYYYRLVASNSMGVSYGATESFVTLAPPLAPSVTTGTATAVTINGATLNGSVNPNNSAVTDYHFEYGTTTAYGTSTTPGTLAAGPNSIAVNAPLTSLVPGQTIHFRLVATNVQGTTTGLDRTFIVTAPAVPPDVDPISVLSTLLSVELTTYDGRHYRWDMEDSNVQNHPLATTFATQMGDGFAEGSCVLPRPIDLDWPDLHLLDRVKFIAADGAIAYEGRVAGLPRRVDSEGEAIEIQLQGLMSSARDRTFMQTYCDRSGEHWQESPLLLRVAYATAEHPLDTDYVPQVDTGSLSFKGHRGKDIQAGSQGVLIWQAPTGVLAKSIQYVGVNKGTSMVKCEPAKLFADDSVTAVLGDTAWCVTDLTFDETLRGANIGATTVPAGETAGPRKFLGLRLRCNLDHDPISGGSAAHRIVKKICVYGDHAVELRDQGESIPDGVYASDVIADIIATYCPLLNADGVEQTTTVLSHLVFDTPTTPFDAMTLVNGYHLWTLGAWENGRVDYGPSDLTKADWQLRREDPGVTLDLQGDTTDQFANGIVVSYTDIDDRAQVLWPTDYPEELADTNVDNPANRQGIELWTSLDLSNPVTKADALALGEAALAEFNRPKAPGTINVTLGYVEDRQGNLQPGHKVRANQTLAISDLPNDTPRLITATNWSEDGALSLTLEQPPTRIDAVLARLELSQSVRGIG